MIKKFLTLVLCLACQAAILSCSSDNYEEDYEIYDDEEGDSTENKLRAPSGLFIYQSGDSIYLSWDPVSNASSYIVYQSKSSSGPWKEIDTVTETEIWLTYKGTSTLYLCVKACNEYEESKYSSYVSTSGKEGSNDSNNENDDNNSGNNGDSNYGNDGGNDNNTNAPSTPEGITASLEGPLMYPYVIISWNMVSDADSYKIYRSKSASGNYSKIGDSRTTSFSDENPMNGTNYYKVTACNSAGESGKSEYASVEYDPNAAAPGAPQWGNCTVSGSTLKLKWSIPTGSGYGTPDKITIRARSASGDYYDVKELSGTSTSYNFTVTDEWKWSNASGSFTYVGVLAENEYGSESSGVKVYSWTERKWLN